MMVVVCPVHGDLWRAPGKRPGDLRTAAGVETCQEGVPQAAIGALVKCPWCASELEQVFRPD